ncbi:hypothetical protein IQ243_22460 [Nostocales cyanobacterium LEGE 11386]|nr:hypothetical protein [Nostocales cyanobacterium LEGE 11386]
MSVSMPGILIKREFDKYQKPLSCKEELLRWAALPTCVASGVRGFETFNKKEEVWSQEIGVRR